MTNRAKTATTETLTTTGSEDLPIIDKARRGRLAALARLRARSAVAGNVVSMFDNTIPRRTAVPVFQSCRGRKYAPLLLTNPIAA
ncbi:hypothetical protein [Maritimibacter sp. UBA3975]|uniref:hypothetical protein n=1 Tax=Maritimibacter sp. UBA3975 TaxID=1946833 RepID=UPI000C0AA98C|nr:hypothetical protein [Maritimibacter sp. UBA3975]MAM61973.1 hypothetical protein [Maritimibacter sp.]|tara:strand:- start:4891 stop:5145 length:255 start_codon:yes stop_codon:yes gene_type:complete